VIEKVIDDANGVGSIIYELAGSTKPNSRKSKVYSFYEQINQSSNKEDLGKMQCKECSSKFIVS